MAIQIARRRNAKLRLGISGVSGGGKTMTSLLLAATLGKKVGLIDSEKGSASLYAGEPGIPEFGVIELGDAVAVSDYRKAINDFAAEGYDVLIVDSLSHSWAEALAAVDRGGGWARVGKVVTPSVAGLIKALLSYPGHVICTMRSKTEYAIEKDEKTGKTTMKKLGLAPQVRGDTEYEFTVVIDLSREGGVTVSKSRCGDALPMDEVFNRADLPRLFERVKKWLDKGAASPVVEALERIAFASDDQTLALAGAYVAEQKAAGTLTAADLERIKAAFIARKTEIANALADDVVPE